MERSEIIDRIIDLTEGAEIDIEGEECSFSVTIISPFFNELNLVQRQQQILALFRHELQTGQLHALSINAYTLREWNEKLNQASGLVQLDL